MENHPLGVSLLSSSSVLCRSVYLGGSKDRNRNKRPIPCHWIAEHVSVRPSIQDVVDMHGKRPSATIERHQPQFVMSSFVAKAQIPTHLGKTLAQTRIHTLHPGHPGNFDDVTDVASTWGSRVGGAPKTFASYSVRKTRFSVPCYELSRVQSKVQAAAITLCRVVTRVPRIYRTH